MCPLNKIPLRLNVSSHVTAWTGKKISCCGADDVGRHYYMAAALCWASLLMSFYGIKWESLRPFVRLFVGGVDCFVVCNHGVEARARWRLW